MENYDKFYNDLDKFSPYEDVLAKKLMTKYDVEAYEKCNNNEYDIKLSNGLTYELKCDVMSKKTGNVYIEYWSRGKKSGVYKSKAEFYAFSFDLKTFYIITKQKLLNLVTTRNYRIMPTNTSNTFGYIIPMREFITYVDYVI